MSHHHFLVVAAAWLLSLLFAPLAHADSAQVRLVAYRVVPSLDGGVARETLQPLEQVKPGDRVVYEATYANRSNAPNNHVQLTVPVPDGGLVYVEGGAQPQAALASLDGKVFKPMPLMRALMLPDGRTVSRPVPAAEIRFLRWDLGDVPAGATRSVRARMQMPALNSQVASR